MKLAKRRFHPSILIHAKIEVPFSVTIGRKTKVKRSETVEARATETKARIVQQELGALLPDSCFVDYVGSVVTEFLGYRSTYVRFTVDIYLPNTHEGEEAAMLLVMKGLASFEPIPL